MNSKEALSDLFFLAIGDENHIKECKEVIEKDLERLEKLEKAIEIIVSKIEFEDLGEMQSGNMYRGYFNDCFNEEEYELLKEVLKNE